MMIYRNIYAFAVLLVVLIFTTSCDQNDKRSGKVRSIGNTSEILVVVENEQQWENHIGQVIREYLGRDQYGLNQAEPIFTLAHVSKTSFSDLLKKHRNILVVEIEEKVTESKIESSIDLWAKPQQIIKITSPSSSDFVSVFESNAAIFEEKFSKTERDRILTVFRASSNKKVVKKMQENFGFKMTIPREFYTAKTAPDFMWIRKEVAKYSQGILIMSEPYQDTAQFSQASIISRIDRNMQEFVPGTVEGSFMVTSDEYVIPKSEVINNFITDYTIETSGIWKVKHDFMGGPFLSYTFLDKRNNQIITLLGYVYQPNKKKRDLLRQLEAILYSTEFV
jgi:hypothetical protein